MVAVAIAAIVVGIFSFVMFEFDPGAFRAALDLLRFAVPAALLAGVPLLLLWPVGWGIRTGTMVSGACAGALWAALTTAGIGDVYLYITSAVLGGLSGLLAALAVVPITQR